MFSVAYFTVKIHYTIHIKYCKLAVYVIVRDSNRLFVVNFFDYEDTFIKAGGSKIRKGLAEKSNKGA